MRIFLLAVYSLLLLALAGPALATDGVAEINHTCAAQTGCFSGDTAGYPVTISEPGSYLLTSNLIVPDKDTDGIKVGTSSVTIDLNGFEIVRSDCVGATTSCIPAMGTGFGSGVERASSLIRGTSVKNGSITGMGRAGVFLGEQAEVSGLRVRWSREDGIRAGIGSIVSGNTTRENGLDGISVDDASTVTDNTAYGNGGDGIRTGAGSTVSGNTAFQNLGDGIVTGVGSAVQRNTVRSNAGHGLRLSSDAAYRENVITNNTVGAVIFGVNRGDNYCAGTGVVSATCP